MTGSRVAVLGIGVAGAACAQALLEAGASVTVVDASDGPAQRERAAALPGAEVLLGESAPDLTGFDLAVLSPGIPPGSQLWKAAHAAHETIGEIELAYRMGVTPVAAVTGTNGKTTVTEMITACLQAGGADAAAAGNIGAPLVAARAGAIVAEVSSFQCATLDRFRVPVAVLTNVAEDHLDWHGSVDAYRDAKTRLLVAAERAAVVHVSCRDLAGHAGAPVQLYDAGAPEPGAAGVLDGWITVDGAPVVEVAALRSTLRPSVENAVAAAAAASALGVDAASIARGLSSYETGAHRLTDLGRAGGVRFIDDSKATDPHATLAAIAAFPGSVLIAGGLNKGLDLGALSVAAPSLRGVVAIGHAAPEIVAAFSGTGVPVEEASEMDEAVVKAYELARPDGTVLLSPACASFDRYTSYAARGDAFAAAVSQIREPS